MEPIELEGPRVRLIPLEASHAEALFEAARNTEPFRYMPIPASIDSAAKMRALLEAILDGNTGQVMTQVVEGKPVGTTGFWDYKEQHRSVEIGFSWLTRRLQGTGVNTESKLLLMRHAFGPLECMRVEFKTDSRNVRSQRALEKLGAVREGVLRSHYTMLEGPRRDSVYYSVLREEWPDVERSLEARLQS